MPESDKHAKHVKDDGDQYMSCKGILAYAGLQRAAGQEPRCLGYKTALPPNIIITEEDVVPPPPEDSKFFFIGVGVSVYNKEMLSKNRLPLVNGFSQLVVSKEEDREKADARHNGRIGEHEAAAAAAAADPRRHGRGQPQPHAAAEAPAQGGRQGAAVPATLSQRSGVAGGGAEEGSSTTTGRNQVEALMAYAVGRIRKQVEITKQVTDELKKLTPGKLREATVVQANKVQEMPTLLLDTSKRMVDSGTKFVRNYLEEQERK
ncbi:unnamed protein product [Ectocarpus fasciculatus]